MPIENNLENLESPERLPEESNLKDLALTLEENTIFNRLQEIRDEINKIEISNITEQKLDEERSLFKELKTLQASISPERLEKITDLFKELKKPKDEN